MASPWRSSCSGAVAMAGIVIVLAVGAALGIERRAHLAHLRAEAPQHLDDHVVVADQDAVGSISAGRWRLPRCQASRAAPGAAPRTSTSASSAALHRDDSRPSSSRSPSPSRSTSARQVEQEVEPAVAQHQRGCGGDGGRRNRSVDRVGRARAGRCRGHTALRARSHGPPLVMARRLALVVPSEQEIALRHRQHRRPARRSAARRRRAPRRSPDRPRSSACASLCIMSLLADAAARVLRPRRSGRVEARASPRCRRRARPG